MSTLSAVRVAAKAEPAQQAMIIFHGLGDSGSGWSFLAEYIQRDLAFSKTRFIFPNAPTLSIVANGNYPMPAWFNIYSWGEDRSRVDNAGLMDSLKTVERFVTEQVTSGIRPENIIVGGFSQGAALALASAVTLPIKIGGFVAFSGFGGFEDALELQKKNMNLDSPIFHGHGDIDPIVSFSKGKDVYKQLTQRFKFSNFTFNSYPGLEHGTSPEELGDAIEFVKNIYLSQ
ncbi:palmitoyl-(protein) hydrolase Ecym_4247 [Eremothecium cymbalariae DBVPG|uniref:Acyl-protein thioesterase 1 n=1 Tax=Eremothecium cymbalariae (strain CBS 270.75 / DBVPG 7215 / KCTC 17166 / NRRL Y-17582) TaxID=931890 RepID=G8JTF9_ERECY|nr:hypothetical protein Ecym_4247 [Eremothecium cymbalariae DBVPG\